MTNTPSAGKGLNPQFATDSYRKNEFWESCEFEKKKRQKEIIELAYKARFGNDEEQEDAQARLAFLKAQKDDFHNRNEDQDKFESVTDFPLREELSKGK
jgi:hypothetical protein